MSMVSTSITLPVTITFESDNSLSDAEVAELRERFMSEVFNLVESGQLTPKNFRGQAYLFEAGKAVVTG